MVKKLKVLIVEDSDDDAQLILQELKNSGYLSNVKRVETSDDMKKALEIQKWDIIISDYSMPNFTGIEALEIFREFHIDIPFILVSGFIGEETAVWAMKRGASDYIMKKNIKKLGPTIKRELAAAKERKNLKRIEKNLYEAYKELKSLEELKTDIISNVSHELRTPITIAEKSIELALREEDVASKNDKLEIALEALGRQKGIVDNLIIVSTIFSKDFKPNLSKEELPLMLNEVLDYFRETANKRNIELEVSLEKGLMSLYVDREAFQQALKNIMENAIKFNMEGEKVEIDVALENNSIHVTVSDKGIGLKKKDLKKIFQPMTQLDSSTRRQYGGTGMGLAVAKHIIELHGGKIWAESEGINKGSEMHFILPYPDELDK